MPCLMSKLPVLHVKWLDMTAREHWSWSPNLLYYCITVARRPIKGTVTSTENNKHAILVATQLYNIAALHLLTPNQPSHNVGWAHLTSLYAASYTSQPHCNFMSRAISGLVFLSFFFIKQQGPNGNTYNRLSDSLIILRVGVMRRRLGREGSRDRVRNRISNYKTRCHTWRSVCLETF